MYSIIGSKILNVSLSRLLDRKENLLFSIFILGGSLVRCM